MKKENGNKEPVAKKSTSKKLTDEEQVKEYISQLPAAQKKELEAVRKIIKSASSKLNERIKWNAPSYYYKPARLGHSGGDDIVTFGPYKTHKLLLVFHHPLIVKVKSTLLEGDYKDRRLTHFKDQADAEANQKELTRIIKELINMIDKK